MVQFNGDKLSKRAMIFSLQASTVRNTINDDNRELTSAGTQLKLDSWETGKGCKSSILRQLERFGMTGKGEKKE